MLSIYKGFETELKRLENSCCYENAYPQKREKESIYAYVEVVSCQSEDWWYRDLIGMEFFCKIYLLKSRNGNIKYIYSVTVVALTKNLQIKGRNFNIKDIRII